MKQLRRGKLMIVIVIATSIIVGGISYWFYQREKKEEALAVTLVENRKVAFGKEVYVSEFIQELKGTLTNNDKIDTTTIGEKEVIVNYKNERNKKKQTKYTIQVVDEEAPVIMLGNSYTVKVGYEKKLTDVIFSGDNCDEHPVRRIEGNYNVNEVGSYPLTFIITDASGNETQKRFILNVVEDTKNNAKEVEKKPIQNVIEQYKTQNTKIGIDVSKWQEEIDWEKVKKSGVEFAILRIGHQDGINGENIVDPYFHKNMQEAKKVGLPVGIYFFSYASTPKEAEEQVDWITEQLQGNSLELPIAFDWENWTSFPKFGVSFYQLNIIANTFMKRVEEKGYIPSLYSSKTYLEKIWTNANYKTWLAHYTEKTNYEGDYDMWQLCETGVVDGINTDVDMDIWYQ